MAAPAQDGLQLKFRIAKAFIDNARYDADLIGCFLQALGPPLNRALQSLPEEFFLELAAILRLRRWEQQGFAPDLSADLPCSEDALVDLLHRWSQGPPAPPPAPPLGQRLHVLWFRRFAWNGPAQLNTDVLLDADDEQEALEALADFLRQHRDAGI